MHYHMLTSFLISQDHIALYQSYPPQRDIPRPRNLLPSAYMPTPQSESSFDSGASKLPSSSDDDGPTLAELYGYAGKSVEEGGITTPSGLLPPHPKRRRQSKRQEAIIDSGGSDLPRYVASSTSFSSGFSGFCFLRSFLSLLPSQPPSLS